MCFMCDLRGKTNANHLYGEAVDDAGSDSALSVGTTRYGSIDTQFEMDSYELVLSAGDIVEITAVGTGTNALADPVLDLYDAQGNLLAWNFDATASTTDARITYEATQDGTYVVGAYASGGITGDYALSVSRTTGNALLDSIDWGTEVTDTHLQVYFATDGEWVLSEGGWDYDSEGWNAYEISRVMAALDMIAAVTNLTFSQTTTRSEAEFVLGLDTDRDLGNGDLGFFNPPDEVDEGVGMFNGRAWDREAGGDLEVGGQGFVTVTHELLHGLGFAHPHDRGGTSVKMDGVSSRFDDYGDYNLNQGIFTTMSYNEGLHTGNIGRKTPWSPTWGAEIGPMALDIALLQEKYGANMSTATGNDTYELPVMNQVGTGWLSIWDAGGTDEITYTGLRDTVIDLRPATLEYEKGGGGFLSAARKVAGGFTIANGVVIENASSDAGNDRLQGNDVANELRAGSGNDKLRGRDGDDTLVGGAGRDKIWGGADNDTIKAGNGRDVVRGNEGDDVVTLGRGADEFVFGAGDGADVIMDFDVAEDTLALKLNLFVTNLTRRDVADRATITDDGVEILFDSGDALLLDGIFTTAGLAQAIELG